MSGGQIWRTPPTRLRFAFESRECLCWQEFACKRIRGRPSCLQGCSDQIRSTCSKTELIESLLYNDDSLRSRQPKRKRRKVVIWDGERPARVLACGVLLDNCCFGPPSARRRPHDFAISQINKFWAIRTLTGNSPWRSSSLLAASAPPRSLPVTATTTIAFALPFFRSYSRANVCFGAASVHNSRVIGRRLYVGPRHRFPRR
jgi:hypothetical protein